MTVYNDNIFGIKEIKLKKHLLMAMISMLAVLPQGCRIIEKTPETPPKTADKLEAEKITVDATNIAKSYQQDFFKSVENKDHVLFCKNLIPELSKKFDAARFKNFCEQFDKEKGKLENIEYLGSLEIGLGRVFLWKVRFAKDFYKLKDGRVMYKDTLFSLLTGQVDGRLRVFDFSFK